MQDNRDRRGLGDIADTPDVPGAVDGRQKYDDNDNDDTADYCRICRGQGTDDQPLFYPCKCSGSIRYVHQECLMEWLAHSRKKYCELCKTPFRFTKLYDQSMPATLPLPLFLRKLFLHGLSTVLRWLRYGAVIVVWLVCLPWCIRQVWRGLFWLADGSWVATDSLLHEEALRRINTSQSNATEGGNASATATTTSNGTDSANLDLTRQEGAQDLSISSLFHSFLRLVTGETLVSKVLRLLFSVPPIQISVPLTAAYPASGPSSGLVVSRPPSLLSDVKLINELTSSSEINHFLLDVTEGLLICLTLVTAFILVFLIREWVINQQPMLNIPDIDPAELPQAPVPPVAREPRARAQHRRPRGQPRDLGRAGAPRQQADDQASLPEEPVLPPHRSFSDDNAALPGGAHPPERPEFPTRSASLSLIAGPSEAAHAHEDGGHFNPAAQPPRLVRGALGDAVSVQRSIEEKVADLVASLDEIEFRINSEAGSASYVAPNDALGRRDEPDQAHAVEEDDWVDTSSLHSEAAAENAFTTDASDVPDAPDAPDASEPSPEADTQPALDPSSGTDRGQQHDRSNVHAQDESLTERVINWFWHVEVEADQDSTEADQEVVGDVHAEAAFVPGHENGDDLLPAAIVQPAPAPAAGGGAGQPGNDGMQEHVPIQIEWAADQNAPEDIDDLEGFFELMGMEGPLVNMVQNVIFSLFLITLTMTASVWIPYVWGKLALILLAHPIAITVRAPALLLSTVADTILDLGLFIVGVSALLCSQLTRLVQFLVKPVSAPLSNALEVDFFEALAVNVTRRSGTRLEKSIAGAANMATLGSDLPTFSIESHRSLLIFKAWLAEAYAAVVCSAHDLASSVARFSWSFEEQRKWLVFVAQAGYRGGLGLVAAARKLGNVDSLNSLFKMSRSSGPTPPAAPPVISAEDLLAGWSTEDKVIAILLGYAFFGLAGFVFMKMSRLFLGLKQDERVPGALADSLHQASGVTKVILIIGIEMLVFPLYCGLLLDMALLPLFEGATIWSRLVFIQRAPFTGLFLHWFIGTCYMFHFALFVSMCRSILRKGVLYFIRDPDDPNFHPVRDVLERPVSTQLGKIALSAVVYGGLAIFCLGGVVWSLDHVDGILPLHWSTAEPPLAFPIDLIFYNFLLPFIIRNFEPTKKLAALAKWWFRTCAHGLRLSHFLFGIEREDEKLPDRNCRFPWSRMLGDDQPGSYVRAPGSDYCRVPKGQDVFLAVSEENERLDGQPDHDIGLHGRRDERWTKVYLPPKFKTRLATFVLLLWVFAAGTGVTLTIGPLVVGRILVKLASGSSRPVNDLYALTVGVHLLGLVVLAASHARAIRQFAADKAREYFPNPVQTLSSLYAGLTFFLSHVYMVTAFGIVLPMALSLITELYIHVPVFTFILRLDAQQRRGLGHDGGTARLSGSAASVSPTLFVLQTWTLGLLYMRIALRVALTYPSQQSRVARAIRSIWRHGWLRPDVGQATRAVILPLTAICVVMLAAPLGYARLLIAVTGVDEAEAQMRLYRYAYPALLGIVVAVWVLVALRKKIELCRLRIRDEMYLVGERLHNYIEEGKDRGGREAVHARRRFAID